MILNEWLKSRGISLPSEYGTVPLTEIQADQLDRFVALFKGKNEVVNLSSIRDEQGIYLKHVYDSLAVFDVFRSPPQARIPIRAEDGEVGEPRLRWFGNDIKILDLGTGGGLPGIPLAIVLPNSRVTLLDATGKKIAAVNEFIQGLGLKNAHGVQGRAEELAHQPSYREQFDLVVSRAVANLAVLVEYALPLVKVGGTFLAYKGKDPRDEVRAAEEGIEALGGRFETISSLSIPLLGERSFIFIQKERGM